MTTNTPVVETPAQRYAAALLSLAVSLITALSAAAAGPWTATVVLSIVVVFLQGVLGYILPLVSGPWAGALKVGVSVVLAGVVAVLPLLTGQAWTFANTLVVILAVVNALAQQLGVSIRVAPVAAPVQTINGTVITGRHIASE